jgi:hypothetical protein
MPTTVSYQTIDDKLISLHETTSAEELGYDLLRVFNGMSGTRIQRIRDGKDNLTKEPNSILVKKLLAYTACEKEVLMDTLEALKQDPKVLRTARLLAVSDGVSVLGFDPLESETYENTVDRLRYDYQFFMPLAGVERYRAPEERDADVKAAYKMARIFDEIRRFNQVDYSDTASIRSLNVFMSRLLFCFFAEDTGIMPDKLFTGTLAEFTLSDGSDLSAFIGEAFELMSSNQPALRVSMPAHLARFPYVNGGLFAEYHEVPNLSWKARKLLLECGELNWADINPDIFGSMIQAVISPELRSTLGSHYTSVSNIMKVIQPLFLDDLYEEFAAVRTNEKRLRMLLTRMGRMKFFDPACGSGNFLIITYKELRKLEILIWEQLEHINHSHKEIPLSNISLTQFYGIEIDEFAHETATLSLWLAEHQMNKAFEDRFQIHVDALPLRRGGHIVQGNACRIDWNDVCPHGLNQEVFVLGNPPYMGSKLQDKNQKEDLEIALAELPGRKTLDYIAAWFWKAAKYIHNQHSRCAFVTTNSICQGEQVALLWPAIYHLQLTIPFAYTSFKWSNNAKYNAGVTVAIIGLANDYQGKRKLYSNESVELVQNITPYLTAGNNLIVTKRNTPPKGFPKMCFGCMPYDNGNLLLTKSEKDAFIRQYPQDADMVKVIMGSQEFIRGEARFCFWIADHQLERALSNPFVSERIARTRAVRLKSSDSGGRKLAARPHQFREFIEELTETIILPRVSSENRDYIPIGFLDNNTVIADSAFAIYDAQLWLFGILTSKMHMAWVKAVGGKLETRYRYSATLCYNTFPFPTLSESKRTELEQAAEAVLVAREMHTEKTLAEMYDPKKMPADLREAHAILDRVVESCYRSIPFSSDEERLEVLFSLYEKMTKKTK